MPAFRVRPPPPAIVLIWFLMPRRGQLAQMCYRPTVPSVSGFRLDEQVPVGAHATLFGEWVRCGRIDMETGMLFFVDGCVSACNRGSDALLMVSELAGADDASLE